MTAHEFEDAPTQQFSWLRKLIPGRLQPLLRGMRKRLSGKALYLAEPFRSVYPYTQVHQTRQYNLFHFAQEIENLKIPGCIVECGVLDGGTAALMAYSTSGSGREVHLFDSWAGLPASTNKDGDAAKTWGGEVVGSPKRVAAIMQKLGIDSQRLVFHRGWFDQTFPKANIVKIALLHIDADFYESVKLCLETWCHMVSPGGYIQIDDYSSFVGCRRAVDEFLLTHKNLKLRNAGKNGTAYFIRIPTAQQAIP